MTWGTAAAGSALEWAGGGKSECGRWEKALGWLKIARKESSDSWIDQNASISPKKSWNFLKSQEKRRQNFKIAQGMMRRLKIAWNELNSQRDRPKLPKKKREWQKERTKGFNTDTKAEKGQKTAKKIRKASKLTEKPRKRRKEWMKNFATVENASESHWNPWEGCKS